MVMSDMVLPDELIFEILLRLPIKSLLRFKCVCKIWRSTIEDPLFIDRHMKQAPLEMVYEDDQGTEFSAIITVQGVTLERHKLNNQQRLRNHATREIFNLPIATERKGICTTMCYILPTHELKVVYIDSSKQGNENVLIYNILRVGTHFTWKRLESSFFGSVSNDIRRVDRLVGSVFHNMRFAANVYIECVDLENESITSFKVPQRLFDVWTHFWNINWNGKLAFAQLEQEQLIIRVLEDYRNHKWAESNIVIPLRFFIDFLSPNISINDIAPFAAHDNQVFWRTKRDYHMFSFDTQSKKVECLTPSSTQRKLLFLYRPSLLPLPFKVEHLQSQIEETQGPIEETQIQTVETQGSLLFRFTRLCLLGA